MKAKTEIFIDKRDDGTYRAWQRDVDHEGIADNPARAVSIFADKVARDTYE